MYIVRSGALLSGYFVHNAWVYKTGNKRIAEAEGATRSRRFPESHSPTSVHRTDMKSRNTIGETCFKHDSGPDWHCLEPSGPFAQTASSSARLGWHRAIHSDHGTIPGTSH